MGKKVEVKKKILFSSLANEVGIKRTEYFGHVN